MSKRPLELFPTEGYVSDYESETSSQIDAGSEISANETHPLRDPELTASNLKPHFPAYGNAKSAGDAERRRTHNLAIRHQLLSMDAYDRHRKLVNDYLQFYGGSWSDFERDKSSDRRDIDVIREHGRFLWSEKDEPTSWSERLAKRYWDKLFKEYCLVDLSRYKENKFGMRWRLEKEVISGKGQFSCGSVHCATTGSQAEVRLRSWEVNFAYKERGERRNALVKLRLCPACSEKLNYRHKRRDVTGSQLVHEHNYSESESVNNSSQSVRADMETVSDGLPSKRSRTDGETKTKSTELSDPDAVWRTSVEAQCSGAPKTLDEEFDEYFADMLL